jgi:hypothetical protein
MQAAHISLALLLPAHDPFAGVLVWGTAGLVAWLSCAALIGIGLHALRRPPASRRAETTNVPHAEDWRDAA